MSLIFLIFSLAIIGVSSRNLNLRERDYCLSYDENPYLLFNTKTAYTFIRQNAGSSTRCKPLQIWILNRHGTRYGDEEDISAMKEGLDLQKEIINNYESSSAPIEEGLCLRDYAALKDWTWDESIETQPDFLNEQGWKDLVGIAQRYKMRYPDLLGGEYSPEDFYFRHSFTQRTQESCKAYIEGLFGVGAHENVKIEEPLVQDSVVQTHAMCQAWIDDVENNDDRKNEKRAFRDSDEYKKLQADLSKRLGYTKILKKDPIDTMYDNCRFDKSRYPEKISPWCGVFSKRELQMMEYYEDLGRYYKSGYGHEYHPKLGCHPLQHLRETFEKTVAEGVAKPKTVALFSHDTLIDMMFTAMNFSRDQEPLKGTDFEDNLVNRRYRPSLNTPFAGNVVAVLHECADPDVEKYQVQFLLNERPMNLDGCDRGLCNWSYLESFLSFTKFCSLDFCDKNKYSAE